MTETESRERVKFVKADVLKQVGDALVGSGAHTISQFQSIIGRFCDHSGGRFTRDQVVSYIKKMDKKGYAAATRAMHYRVLKRCFEIMKVEWPFGKRAPSELPVSVAEWDVVAPPIPVEELKTIISNAKNGGMPADWVALTAVSTIYGLRRIELTEITPECIDLGRGLMRVVTAKHGRAREHLIPDVIKPYMEAYPYEKYSAFKLSQVYHGIREASGLPTVYGAGFHSVRRSLVTSLSYVFPEPIVRDFLRWKKSSVDMVRRYWTPPSTDVVEKIIFGMEPFPTYGGEMVYGQHPFLEMWSQEKG